MRSILKNTKGVAVLIMVIIISVISVSIGVAATLISIDEIKSGFNNRRSLEIFTASDGCVEEALVKLNSNHSYTGEILNIGNINCTIAVSGSGSTRTINVTAAYQATYTRELEINVDWSSSFQISSWEEVTT